MSSPISEAILTHLRSEQRPSHRDHLIDEIVMLAKASPGAYPNASKPEWKVALDELIKAGRVSSVGERVAFIRQRDAGRDESEFLF